MCTDSIGTQECACVTVQFICVCVFVSGGSWRVQHLSLTPDFSIPHLNAALNYHTDNYTHIQIQRKMGMLACACGRNYLCQWCVRFNTSWIRRKHSGVFNEQLLVCEHTLKAEASATTAGRKTGTFEWTFGTYGSPLLGLHKHGAMMLHVEGTVNNANVRKISRCCIYKHCNISKYLNVTFLTLYVLYHFFYTALISISAFFISNMLSSIIH